MTKLANLSGLEEYQSYIKDALVRRGFIHQDVNVRFGLLVEEVGELAKALRKHNGEKIATNSDVTLIQDELADVFFVLLSIANSVGINLKTAFIEKEEKNNKRTWI